MGSLCKDASIRLPYVDDVQLQRIVIKMTNPEFHISDWKIITLKFCFQIANQLSRFTDNTCADSFSFHSPEYFIFKINVKIFACPPDMVSAHSFFIYFPLKSKGSSQINTALVAKSSTADDLFVQSHSNNQWIPFREGLLSKKRSNDYTETPEHAGPVLTSGPVFAFSVS